MAEDSITGTIDRIFDAVDRSVEKIDHVLNRGKSTGEKLQETRAKHAVVIDTATAVKVKRAPASSRASTSLALASRTPFRIVEAISASSGQTIFVVTNGGAARAECTTREMAERILQALEAAA